MKGSQAGWAVLALALLAACVTESRSGAGEGTGPSQAPSPKPDRTWEAASGGSGVGWRDGVGPGRPWAVPMSLDYFQGFLVRAGVDDEALPGDGRTLTPQQALALVPRLLATPVTLANFGPRRMAAQLFLEVATGGVPVERETLHTRMRRFSELLVVRPDGYLVRTTTGEALQWAGNVVLSEGALRAGAYEVGPFYRRVGGRLYPVDAHLEVPSGAEALGAYRPDDGVMSPLAEGSFLAVVDTVEGLIRLVFQTQETLEGIARLPGAVRELYAHAPEMREAFGAKPYAEQVRTLSRLTTGVLLVLGSAGTGTAKVASWGGALGNVSIPVLSLTGDGLLAMRIVVVPAGAVVASSGVAVSATYVQHMANVGAQGANGGGAWPPVGGPGRWVEDTAHMSEQARTYQAQVTGAPRGWSYRVCRGGDCVEYDGYDPKTDTLLEAKAAEYDKWFDAELKPRWKFRGLDGLVEQAGRQNRMAVGLRVRWMVAEPRMVTILQKAFGDLGLTNIEVVYMPPQP